MAPDTAISTTLDAALVYVFAGLARARDEAELFTACEPYLQLVAPARADLLGLGDGGALEPLARWTPEVELPSDAGSRVDMPALPWRQRPVFVADVATDASVDDATRASLLAAGVAATAILPLRCEAAGADVGALRLDFAAARALAGDERRALETVAHHLAAFLAARRVVTRQREAIRALERERASYHAVIDNLPVGVFLAEAGTGKVLLVNHVGVEMLGRGVDPAANPDNYSEVYQCLRVGTDEPVPETDLPLVRTLGSGEPCQGALDILHPGGKRVTIDVASAPIHDVDGTMFAAVATFSDVTERNRVEAERTAYREELIRAQALALAERSTPLVPLGDDIVAMPLVGTLDRERADQIVDTLLTGCAERKARFAILDVTGVPHADTAVASALVRAAAAVRLLGVEPILTGIRPDVARALVALAVDLKGLVTLSTLQDGIRHATRPR